MMEGDGSSRRDSRGKRGKLRKMQRVDGGVVRASALGEQIKELERTMESYAIGCSFIVPFW